VYFSKERFALLANSAFDVNSTFNGFNLAGYQPSWCCWLLALLGVFRIQHIGWSTHPLMLIISIFDVRWRGSPAGARR
jgi:hypothetical protein